jgi:prepilin signal peptidase PulO-like enzyme (type II secretory pathway)
MFVGMVERVPLALVAALIGWLIGWLSATVTAWLEGEDATAPPEGLRGLIARDPLVQGCCAVAWAIAALWLTGDWWRPFAGGLLAVPLVQVAVTDFRTRYVYTIYAAVGLALGLGLGWLVHGAPWWTSVAGALGGLVSFGFLYGVGRLLFKREAMARGDITIATMVGAGAATCTPQALFYGVLIGGIFGAAALIFRRQLGTFMPYGPGLCLGGLVTLYLC